MKLLESFRCEENNWYNNRVFYKKARPGGNNHGNEGCWIQLGLNIAGLIVDTFHQSFSYSFLENINVAMKLTLAW